MVVGKNEIEQDKLERELLGILSNYPTLVDRVVLKSEYFQFDVHQKLYKYIKEFKKIDYAEMIKTFNLQELEDVTLRIITQNIYTDNSCESMLVGFSKLLLERYKLREISKLDELRELGRLPSDKYYTELTNLKDLNVEPQADDLTENMIDDVMMMEEKGISIDRFAYLSNCLKLNPTDVVTVAGTSGFGKSALLLNFYQALSQDSLQRFKCHYFNVEVNPMQIIKRLLAITSNTRIDELVERNIDKDFYKMAKAKLLNACGYVHSGSITIEELKAMAITNLDKEKINVLFVDHVGLLDVEEKAYNRSEYDRVTYCMKELRKLALDYNCLIFIASQFDRSSVKENKISMHSLKSSGEIENSSTHVLLLKHSEVKTSVDPRAYEEIAIDVAKNRNGEKQVLDFYTFIKTKQLFNETSR